jgi:hypothetical protein
MFIDENIIRRALRQSINEMMQEDRVESQDGTVEIDNFQNVRDIMNFKNPGDTLYFVELIRRKKDNPSMNHSRQFIGQYYFKSQQEFDAAEQAIKEYIADFKEDVNAYREWAPKENNSLVLKGKYTPTKGARPAKIMVFGYTSAE